MLPPLERTNHTPPHAGLRGRITVEGKGKALKGTLSADAAGGSWPLGPNALRAPVLTTVTPWYRDLEESPIGRGPPPSGADLSHITTCRFRGRNPVEGGGKPSPLTQLGGYKR
jgi:hypothetical protein